MGAQHCVGACRKQHQPVAARCSTSSGSCFSVRARTALFVWRGHLRPGFIVQEVVYGKDAAGRFRDGRWESGVKPPASRMEETARKDVTAPAGFASGATISSLIASQLTSAAERVRLQLGLRSISLSHANGRIERFVATLAQHLPPADVGLLLLDQVAAELRSYHPAAEHCLLKAGLDFVQTYPGGTYGVQAPGEAGAAHQQWGATAAQAAAEGPSGEGGTVMILEQPLMFWIVNLLARPTALCLWLLMTAVRLCFEVLEVCGLLLRKTLIWGASSIWAMSRRLGVALLAAKSQVLIDIRWLWAPAFTSIALALCVAAWQRGPVLQGGQAQPPPARHAARGGAGALRQRPDATRRRPPASADDNASPAARNSKHPLVAGCELTVNRPALTVQQNPAPSARWNSLPRHPSANSLLTPNATASAPKAPQTPPKPQEVPQCPSPPLRQHRNEGHDTLTANAQTPSPQPVLMAGTAAACCKAGEVLQPRKLHQPQQLPLSESPLQTELQSQVPVPPPQLLGAAGLRNSEHGAQPQQAPDCSRAPTAAAPPPKPPAQRGASGLQGAPQRYMLGPEPEGAGGEAQCVVCWERPVAVQLAPCGHMCLCG